MYLEELSPGVVSCPKRKHGDWGDARHGKETKEPPQDEAKPRFWINLELKMASLCAATRMEM